MRPRVLSCAISIALLVPLCVQAGVSVVEDSCTVLPNDQVRIYFTVIDINQDDDICSMNLLQEGQPPACTIQACGPGGNWACWLDGSGGAGFAAPPTSPSDCITAELGGFSVTVQAGTTCCYNAQFFDRTFALIAEQEECFTQCDTVALERVSWPTVKKLYRE